EPLTQRDLCLPAERRKLGPIQQLLWRSVWPRGIENDLTLVADHLGDRARKIGDGHVAPESDVEKSRRRIVLHHEDAGIGEIIDMQKFASRSPGAPYRHAGQAGEFCFVETA